MNNTIEKVAPAIFVVQAPKYPIVKGEQAQKLRTWEQQLGQAIGIQISNMQPEGPNETWSGSGDGWDECRFDK